MAKKIRTVLTLQLPAGKATPAPPVGTALGPHGINIVEFTQDLQREDRGPGGPGHPGPDHHLRGPQLHVHPQDAARRGPAAQGRRRREGLATTGREHGRHGHPRPGARDRPDQDGRPQRRRPRGRVTHHRGHRPLDGHRGRRLARHGPRSRRARSTRRPSARPPRVDRGRPTRAARRNIDDAAARQALPGAREARRPRARSTRPSEAIDAAQGDREGQLRPLGRGPHPPRRRPAPRRPDGARHGRAAARRGQDRPRASSSPRATRPRRRSAPAPTRSAARTSSSASRPAGSSSTSRSPRPT